MSLTLHNFMSRNGLTNQLSSLRIDHEEFGTLFTVRGVNRGGDAMFGFLIRDKDNNVTGPGMLNRKGWRVLRQRFDKGKREPDERHQHQRRREIKV